MKTKFLSLCTGLTLVLFGTAFFIYSINHANAASANSRNFIMNEVGKTGKYQVSIGLGRDGYMYAVVINTESGKSESYYYNTEASGNWVKMTAQLPGFTF
ncbi:MAG: hypothetical protein JNJ40_00445 [Bacteroidia bacterium]|nr:hypothetical protein [Bacteroidia bacterium]